MSNLLEGEYNKYTWSRWPYIAGNMVSLRRASPPIPPKHGVYLFRASRPIARVKGTSNIIYIGQSGGGKRSGVQGIGPSANGGPGRLFNVRGLDEVVREYIESLFPEEEFSVECYFTNNNEDPEQIESRLLLAYLKTHFELPPANSAVKQSLIE